MLLMMFILLNAITEYPAQALHASGKINATVTRMIGDLKLQLEDMTQEYISDRKSKRILPDDQLVEFEYFARSHNDDLMNRFSKRAYHIISEGSFKVEDNLGSQTNREALENARHMVQKLSIAWIEEAEGGNSQIGRAHV